MKKLLLLTLMALVAVTVFAQANHKKPAPAPLLPLGQIPYGTTLTPWIDQSPNLIFDRPIYISSLIGRGGLADTICFEMWPDRGIVITLDTLTITGNKIQWLRLNGKLYQIWYGGIAPREASDYITSDSLRRLIQKKTDFPREIREW